MSESESFTRLLALSLLVDRVSFALPGTNLLSGGLESVLVQWRYKQDNQRDFLPRLGAAITHVTVSPDGALFCTSHSDNSKGRLPVSFILKANGD